jgi:hypothetical protein
MVLQIRDILPYDVFGGIIELLIFLVNAITDSSTFSKLEFVITGSIAVLLSFLIILMFLWMTKKIFMVFHSLEDPFVEWVFTCGTLIATLFIFTRPVFQPTFYATAVKTAGSELIAISFIFLDIVLWNFWWIAVIIFPTLIIYPEIRKKGLWRHVVGCFLITIILRYLFEFLLTFTFLKQYSVFSDGIAYSETDFNFFYGGMILITLVLAFVSYRILMELEQRVPWVKSCLSTEKN